ncbi:hypothetical protein Pan44_44240 [Caulifigura coniformis]|uniref:Uncharacterized protein n=2 Tax=Caulifigura coniformis TaxID=2527983 RepID=A0A517SJS0_9PLAN|nr:hypothetical protein Pan44_44240 [Caulifigura coniformis]
MGGRGNTVADEENPFDIDTSVLQKAIPVSPKATKQRTLEVKCPMCETIGFVAPQHQGKGVKCANPDCKHPYFDVPLPKKESADGGLKKKKGMSIGQVIGIVVASIALVGTALWYFVARVAPEDPNNVVNVPKPPGPPEDEPKKQAPVAVKRISLDEIRQGAINELVRLGSTPDPNRGLAYRFLAESYAGSGQAQKGLDELKKLEGSSPYFQVEPLVRLYLQARKTKAPDAGKFLDLALKAAENLPKEGRAPLDAASALAAALVLADRLPEAQALTPAPRLSEGRTPAEESNRLDFSMLWTAAVYGNMFDFQVLSEIPAWLASPHPQHAAVTWILASWGESEKALAWAKTAGSVEAVDGSLAVWAAHLGMTAKSTSEGVLKLEAAISDASPAGQSRAWANFAYQRAVAGDAAGAKELMAKADAALNSIPAASPVAMPTVRQIYDSQSISNLEQRERAGLPHAGSQRSAALAAANLAVLHLKLGDKAPVEALLMKGLDYAEAIAPALPQVAALRARESNARAMEAELDRELGLKGNKTKSFTALTQFRRQLTYLEKESTKRDQFERELIRDIAYRGEPGLAWKVVQQRDQLDPPERRPMLSQTPLASYIAVTAVAQGDTATANATGKTKIDDKIDLAINGIVFNMKSGNFAAALNELKTIYRAGTYDRNRLDIALLRRISQFHTFKKNPEKVFDLIKELPDPQVQEAAMYLMAARAVVEDQAPELYKLTSPDRMQRSLSFVERAALARGYVAGVEAAPKPQAVAKDSKK